MLFLYHKLFFLLLTFQFIKSSSWHSCVLTPVQNFPVLIHKQLKTASDCILGELTAACYSGDESLLDASGMTLLSYHLHLILSRNGKITRAGCGKSDAFLSWVKQLVVWSVCLGSHKHFRLERTTISRSQFVYI